MATIATLADAVVAELNAAAFSADFVARRHYCPRFQPADLKALQVSVVPKALVIEPASREGDGRHYQIDLAVQQRLETESLEEIDQLASLVEEIARHFRLRRLASMPAALCVKIENRPVYAVEHLDELRCFTSILTLTFLVL